MYSFFSLLLPLDIDNVLEECGAGPIPTRRCITKIAKNEDEETDEQGARDYGSLLAARADVRA